MYAIRSYYVKAAQNQDALIAQNEQLSLLSSAKERNQLSLRALATEVNVAAYSYFTRDSEKQIKESAWFRNKVLLMLDRQLSLLKSKRSVTPFLKQKLATEISDKLLHYLARNNFV